MASIYSLYAKRRDANQDYNNEREGRLAALQRQTMMDERQGRMDAQGDIDFGNKQFDRSTEINNIEKKKQLVQRIAALPEGTTLTEQLNATLTKARMAEADGDLTTAKFYYDLVEQRKPKEFGPGSSGPPTKIQEYEYAKAVNGYKGSLADWLTLGPNVMANAMAPLRSAQTGNIKAENDYNLPAAKSSSVTVTVGGKTYSFPDNKSANKFKMHAGAK